MLSPRKNKKGDGAVESDDFRRRELYGRYPLSVGGEAGSEVRTLSEIIFTVVTVGASLEYVLGLDASKHFTSNENALANGLLEGVEKDMHLPDYLFSYTGLLGRKRCSPSF
jgi:hypothetical protein